MARFLITPEWKGAKVPGGPGRVVLRIMGRDCVTGKVRRVRVNTRVTGYGESVLVDKRKEIVGLIRGLHAVIVRRVECGDIFGVDDVVRDFRGIMEGDGSVQVEKMAREDVALRGDLVSLGGGFKGDFRFVYPVEEKALGMLMEYVASLEMMAKSGGKDSRVRTFGSVRRSLSRFLEGEDVRLESVDRVFLEDYSVWLGMEGVAGSTQSFYLRALRSVLNQAKKDGVFSGEENLFAGLNTRVIFNGKDVSASVGERGEGAPLPSHGPSLSGQSASLSGGLSREVMWGIANMDLSEDEGLMVVRDMFMFAFYCKGMELTDVLNLTRECVHEGMLTYRRRSNGRVKSVILDENAMSILQRYDDNVDAVYLFPLRDMHRGLRQYSVNGVVRRSLRRIGEMAGEPGLTFGMNIATWRSLVSQIDPVVMLRGSA